jgi:hypothetical protein
MLGEVVTLHKERRAMTAKRSGSFRADLRSLGQAEFHEYVGRAHELTPTGCTITGAAGPLLADALELRLYLPGTEWPLAVHHAEVTWSRWDTITVEFRDSEAAAVVAHYLACCESEAA